VDEEAYREPWKESVMTDNDLRERLSHALREIASPEPNMPEVARGMRRRRFRGQAVTGGLTVLALTAGVLSLWKLAPLGSSTSRRSASSVFEGHITCTDQATKVETPIVATSTDGVHLRLVNETKETMSFEVSGALGENAPVGTSEFIASVSPGSHLVRCAQSSWVSLVFEDPDGNWISTSLDCRGGTIADRSLEVDPNGTKGDPLTLAREEWPGILPTDRVERAGYVASSAQTIRVVRDGRIIATFDYVPDGLGGWLKGAARVCVDDLGASGG
jgi:hypothetical protein